MSAKIQKQRIKDQIFSCLCYNAIGIFSPNFAVSTNRIAKSFEISYYLARKYLKELEKEGLIEYINEYVEATFGYETMELEQDAFWNRGWIVTPLAAETVIHKNLEKEEHDLIEEIWGNNKENQK